MNLLRPLAPFALLALALAAAGCPSSVGANHPDAVTGPDAALDGSPVVDAAADARTDVAVDAPPDAPLPVDAGGACRAEPAEELRVPRVARAGAPVPVAVRSASRGCGCTPRLLVSGARLDFAVCACCEACECVDPEYVGNEALAGLAADRDTIVTSPPRSASVRVVPADLACRERVRIERVRIVTDNGARFAGPRRVWAEVSGVSNRCSEDVLPLIETTPGNPIFLRPLDCNVGDCRGPEGPRPFTTWVSLGELPPGRHMVFYSPGISQEFEVR